MQPRAATAACRCAWSCLPTGWATNPSPYMFFFTSDDVELAGASPETLTRLEGGVVKTFPLAGTRARAAQQRPKTRRLKRVCLPTRRS